MEGEPSTVESVRRTHASEVPDPPVLTPSRLTLLRVTSGDNGRPMKDAVEFSGGFGIHGTYLGTYGQKPASKFKGSGENGRPLLGLGEGGREPGQIQTEQA